MSAKMVIFDPPDANESSAVFKATLKTGILLLYCKYEFSNVGDSAFKDVMLIRILDNGKLMRRGWWRRRRLAWGEEHQLFSLSSITGLHAYHVLCLVVTIT